MIHVGQTLHSYLQELVCRTIMPHVSFHYTLVYLYNTYICHRTLNVYGAVIIVVTITFWKGVQKIRKMSSGVMAQNVPPILKNRCYTHS